MLEQATAADATNGALWNALARAYFLQSAAAGQGGGPPSPEAMARALEPVQRAHDASERALRIDANDPIALSNHGTALRALSLARKDREGMSVGASEVNRAVELAPSLIPPRVKRGIAALGLPPRFRNVETLIEDVNVLIAVSEGTRAGDMLHLFLGDVYADAGRAEEAQRQYEAAARPSSVAAEQARARLAALDQGGIPAAETARLRASVGTCTTCHAQ
jgi:tetratricopeptide (TPR) repeat protein